MDVARIREGIRKMRFSAIWDRWESGEIGQDAAAELLGMSVRSFQRWKDRYEAEGEAGLVDQRGGPSPRRAPQEEVERMLGLYRDKYADFTVKHFHEQLTKRHGYTLGYTVTKIFPAPRRAGQARAQALGAPQEAAAAAGARDRVPMRGVTGGGIAYPGGAGLSDCHGGQNDDWIIADWGDGFQCHVAGALDGPFVVLFHEDGSDEADDGVLVWEDSDDIGSPLDLAVGALDGIGRADLVPMLPGESHESKNIDLGLVEQGGEPGKGGAQLIGDVTPLFSGGVRRGLGEGGGDEGRDDAATTLVGMRQGVAHEVNAAAFQAAPSTLAAAALRPSCASEMTSLTPRRPRRASLRKNSLQKVSASEGQMSRPRTSRRPSPLTPMATTTAVETMRPARRTFT